ncbi:MAG: L-threonylcarbamoyladenylate synthase [Clostridia bacterium]|nr:L-threonylcarbamoyladenylate synthase [Clostridia bacterium]
MKTEFLSENSAERAAKILKSGGIVAIPTETVYGLAASVYDKNAIKAIFTAKGRPSDNPLIVHISDLKDIENVVSEFPKNAKKLAEKFWPGPLTMIMPKNPKIPKEVTGGLNSVAVRYPSHEVARKIIALAGVPLVAPSANTSGKPSPTKFEHVVNDLNGKVNAIVDGGECAVGLESTVVSTLSDIPKILRPGKISAEDIKSVVGAVEIDKAIFEKPPESEKVLSPGMKYKHYSPDTPIKMVVGDTHRYVNFVNLHGGEDVGALCFDEDIPFLKVPYISYGSANDTSAQSKNLFEALREADKLGVKTLYAHYKETDSLSLAVYNRLVRAAAFNVIKV